MWSVRGGEMSTNSKCITPDDITSSVSNDYVENPHYIRDNTVRKREGWREKK